MCEPEHDHNCEVMTAEHQSTKVCRINGGEDLDEFKFYYKFQKLDDGMKNAHIQSNVSYMRIYIYTYIHYNNAFIICTWKYHCRSTECNDHENLLNNCVAVGNFLTTLKIFQVSLLLISVRQVSVFKL